MPALKPAWPAAAALLTALIQGSGLLAPAERLVGDALQRTLPARSASKVAVVLIDEEALRQGGPWPWPRARLAQLVDRVADAGAQGVALDFLLPEARPGDDQLATALGRLPVVLPVGLDEGRILLPSQGLRTAVLAQVNFSLDGDGVVRSFPSTLQRGDRQLPALAVAAARLLTPDLPVPVGRTLRPAWRARTLPALGAATVLAGQGLEPLRGRVVLIGASATGIGDRWVTPASPGGTPEPGVQVEAAATEAILTRDLLRSSPPLVSAALALVLAGLGAWVVAGPGGCLALGVLPFLLAATALRGFGLALAPVAMAVGILAPGILVLARSASLTRRGLREARARIQALESLRQAVPPAGQREAEARRVLAHELKTPLTSLRGLGQLLARFDLTREERDRVAGLVVAESTRLAQMVDGLLDLERLTFRDFSLEAVPLALDQQVAARLDVLRASAGARDRTWEVELAPAVTVLGDPGLLDRVVENLVGNALKFSPAGSPLRVTLVAKDGEAQLEVEDRGPGVPEAERGAIFGRFKRGGAGSLAPGLGLGLALVAEAAAWHRGRVEVVSGGSGGSLFRVKLPLAPAHSGGDAGDNRPGG